MKHFLSFPLIYIALAGICGLSVASCRNIDDEPLAALPTVSNIVTYEGFSGGMARFSFQRIDDSPMVHLTAPVQISGNPGDRCLMVYVPVGGDESQSGTVELINVAKITSMPVEVTDMDKYPDWDATPVYVNSLWRSGNWINLHCTLPYNPAARMFGLIVDESTADSPAPQLYIAHKTPAGDTFDRTYYASFYIGDFISAHPQAQMLQIHVNNSNLPQDTFTLSVPGNITAEL